MPNDLNKNHVEHVFIVIHGMRSDAGVYWNRMNRVTKDARGHGLSGLKRRVAIVAPILFSDKFTPGMSRDNQLTWRRPDDWISGATANRPVDTKLTSINALEALIDEFSNKRVYPRMTNITFVGQSAGGQLVQRFAAISKDPPSPGIHIRYIQNNPSSCAYFTTQRPKVQNETLPSVDLCKGYNVWRYGFDAFPGSSGELMGPREYFRRYTTRDVVATVGYLDTDPEKGGQKCQEIMQGGRERRDRNLVWYRYINELARSGEDLDRFPGQFEHLPDWSDVSNSSVTLRLAVAETAGHAFLEVFGTKTGRSALYADSHVLPGWRP